MIHAHFGGQGVRVAPVAEKLQIPLVVTFYGSDISAAADEEFWRRKYQALWPRVGAVTVLSEDMKEKAQSLGCPPSKIRIVHLSRDLEDFPFDPPEQKISNVLFVGRLVPKKAPIDTLEAVRTAREKGAQLRLDVVGDGCLREKVEQYVTDKNMQNVRIHGRVPSSEVGKYMREADAFLLPSKTAPNGDEEGTPTVLVEAQATGLPCVTTHHSGIPEMIPEKNRDLLSTPGNIESLAATLLMLTKLSVEDVQARAEAGRRKVEQEFNLSEEVRKLLSVYRRAAKE
ncbi:glycosyltransferase involved in cell wall biosynthesis [Salinibacter ruber]|nr:glycosyltransferase involved in cell wall biosynthesis [Salinibacter ruber]